jgi:hypothetical protein
MCSRQRRSSLRRYLKNFRQRDRGFTYAVSQSLTFYKFCGDKVGRTNISDLVNGEDIWMI